jgi:hypothetical protein
MVAEEPMLISRYDEHDCWYRFGSILLRVCHLILLPMHF